MSEFPSIQPAFTIKIALDPALAVGSASRGATLQVIPFSSGTFKSAEGFSPSIDAEIVGVGNDYIHADPDGSRLRLDAHGTIKTQDGALIYVNYTGVVTVGDAESNILTGKTTEGATPFGNSFTHVTFETGHERYKDLENRVFVGKGRFVAEKDKPLSVEYRVGQVVHA
ncbi:DUF3237 domain-containing protein [Aspergillus puulaauensis]|uniref:Uncharacterized protein n=1 Tax=Aspergillus puulaauensis TaxID=1220207 RepID=A0A7R7XS68_9EURO|nr:uncharacterized protein APUU_50599A [Aspergillus puulaauensis]BCS25888.1 hypothetical protein APUU_50599A [Aspergillus puulaauensis]